jgi:hypothetical protein
MFDVHTAAILPKLDFYRRLLCEANFVRSRLIENEIARDYWPYVRAAVGRDPDFQPHRG